MEPIIEPIILQSFCILAKKQSEPPKVDADRARADAILARSVANQAEENAIEVGREAIQEGGNAIQAGERALWTRENASQSRKRAADCGEYAIRVGEHATRAMSAADRVIEDARTAGINDQQGVSRCICKKIKIGTWVEEDARLADRDAVQAEKDAAQAEKDAVQAEQVAFQEEQMIGQASERAICSRENATEAEEAASHSLTQHAKEQAMHAKEQAMHAKEEAIQAEEYATWARNKATRARESADKAREIATKAEERATNVRMAATKAKERANCTRENTDSDDVTHCSFANLDYGEPDRNREPCVLDWSDAIASAGIPGDITKYSVYILSRNCMREYETERNETFVCLDSEKPIRVDLHALSAERAPINEVDIYMQGETKLLSGSSVSQQSFFPLAIDDYFMAVAILSRGIKDSKDNEDQVGVCVVSNESPRVLGIGRKGTTGRDAEVSAILNAQQSRVDLKDCALYTTGTPSLKCIEVILNAGIRVVVHGGNLTNGEAINKVYQSKACFKKYKCYIQIEDEEKKFLINPPKFEVVAKKFILEQGPQNAPEPNPDPVSDPQGRPSYRDFFMAMAFLAHARTKDNKYQVGACLVTPAPHRLVAMGYNGMPDGRGFRDMHMDWGSLQSPYLCHAELNAVIAAFRREADLSACTLYVTYSPCGDCCKLIAQSGIKNVVFAKYYKNAKHQYKILGRLPDVNITRYEYMKTEWTEQQQKDEHGQKKNNAKITLNLEDLSIQENHSSSRPQTGWEFENPSRVPMECPKGRRDVDFPKDDYFMALALLATSRSPFEEKDRVGACLVYHEPRRAISVGYNGYLNDRRAGVQTEGYVCCAESNAIVSAFRYHADLTKATLYTTGVPCHKCATKIVQSGIKTVIYNGKRDMEKGAEKIFYWAKIATLEYMTTTKKPIIEIDLQGLTIEQKQV